MPTPRRESCRTAGFEPRDSRFERPGCGVGTRIGAGRVGSDCLVERDGLRLGAETAAPPLAAVATADDERARPGSNCTLIRAPPEVCRLSWRPEADLAMRGRCRENFDPRRRREQRELRAIEGGRPVRRQRSVVPESLAEIAGRDRPAERFEPRLESLIGDPHLDVASRVSGHGRVGGLLHIEHVQHIVVLEELEQP